MNLKEAIDILTCVHENVPRSVQHVFENTAWETLHDAIGVILWAEANPEITAKDLKSSMSEAPFLAWWGEHQATTPYRPSQVLACAFAAWSAWQASGNRNDVEAEKLLAEIGQHNVARVLPEELVERVREHFKRRSKA